MKIKFRQNGYFAKLYEKCTLTLECDLDYKDALIDLSKMCQGDVELDIEVSMAKSNRSTNANAYAWVLLGKLAQVLGLTPEEVYQQQILDMYTYRDVLVKTDEIEGEKKEWVKDHLGRDFKVIGPSKEHTDYSWCRKWRSSSDFDTMEMSRLIDNIVFECSQFGIETKTPAQIEKMLAAWKG